MIEAAWELAGSCQLLLDTLRHGKASTFTRLEAGGLPPA